ncbi:MAG: NAD(P)H-dependent glycerol-3-phosphate dehydrogenase [Bacteroidota bacterium]|nr:NAD(P)H-dependent glycerol-3-phosphate dehydrogenase [Bacteroidota bacterium]
MNIIIIGAGTFGTAIANELLFNERNKVVLYSDNIKKVDEINSLNTNKSYFPNKVLHHKIRASTDISVFDSANIIFIALPSSLIKSRIKKIKNCLSREVLIVNLSKGIFKNGITIVEYLKKYLQTSNVITLKGPSFASEILEHSDTLLTLGYTHQTHFKAIQNIFQNTCIHIDSTEDIKGVELLSVLKNIYALLMGIIDAKYNSPNTRFMFLTKAFSEMRLLLIQLGGKEATLLLGCGFGDLCLTSLNDLSRNRTLGLFIGKGFFNTNNEQHVVVLEGLNAIRMIKSLSLDITKDLPLLNSLYNFLNNDTKRINIDFDNLLE